MSIPTFTIYGTEGASRVEWNGRMERESRREGEVVVGRDIRRRDNWDGRKVSISTFTIHGTSMFSLGDLSILVYMQTHYTSELGNCPSGTRLHIKRSR